MKRTRIKRPVDEDRRIGFSSGDALGVVSAYGGRPTRFEPLPEDDAVWAFGPSYLAPDGSRRVIVCTHPRRSMQETLSGRLVRRNWLYRWDSGQVTELLAGEKISAWKSVVAVLKDGRTAFVNATIDGEPRVVRVDLEADSVDHLTEEGWGHHYGETISPDETRIAWHVTSSVLSRTAPPNFYAEHGYSINVMELTTRERTLVAGTAGHLYFGTKWSPDGTRLAFLDCRVECDPAHFWADICVACADGSSTKVVGGGQCHWFGTSHGQRGARGGGSNLAVWAPDSLPQPQGTSAEFGANGLICQTARLPGSHPDVVFDPSRPDHEEFVYTRRAAKGGTYLRLVDPDSGEFYNVTSPEEGRWDFRPAFSPAGNQMLFTRTWPGKAPQLWIAKSDGSDARLLTRGFNRRGADFGRWLD